MSKSQKKLKTLNTFRMPFAVVSLLDEDTASIEGAKRDGDLINELSVALFNDDYLGMMVFEQKLSDSGRDIYDLEFVLSQPNETEEQMNIIRVAICLNAKKVVSRLIRDGAKAHKKQALDALEEIKMTISLPNFNPDELETCLEMYKVIASPNDISEAYYYLECAANSEDHPSVRMAAEISAKYISEFEQIEIASTARAPGQGKSARARAMRM